MRAAQEADRLRSLCLSDARSFAYETVFSTPRRIEDLRKAREGGFFIRFFFVSTRSPEINLTRVERRVALGGHGVPPDKIEARYRRSMENMLAALRISDRGYVFDNSVEDRDPLLLFRTVEGAVKRLYVERVLPWAAPALDALRRGDASPD